MLSLGTFYALTLLLLPVLVWLAKVVRRKPYVDVFFGIARVARYTIRFFILSCYDISLVLELLRKYCCNKVQLMHYNVLIPE